ncbi:MAG: hypothetical protein AAF514_13110 [Verrucomicrobiota bacterium]
MKPNEEEFPRSDCSGGAAGSGASARTSVKAGGDLVERASRTIRQGTEQVKDFAENKLPEMKESLTGGAYQIAYGLGFGIGFGGAILDSVLPDWKERMANGSTAGREAADKRSSREGETSSPGSARANA